MLPHTHCLLLQVVVIATDDHHLVTMATSPPPLTANRWCRMKVCGACDSSQLQQQVLLLLLLLLPRWETDTCCSVCCPSLPATGGRQSGRAKTEGNFL